MKHAPNTATFKMRGRALAAARAFIARGFAPVPVEPRGKAGVPGWDKLTLSAENAAHHFNGQQNVGLRLGAASRGLCDVVLDDQEAVALAPRFLPPTANSLAAIGQHFQPVQS